MLLHDGKRKERKEIGKYEDVDAMIVVCNGCIPFVCVATRLPSQHHPSRVSFSPDKPEAPTEFRNRSREFKESGEFKESRDFRSVEV